MFPIRPLSQHKDEGVKWMKRFPSPFYRPHQLTVSGRILTPESGKCGAHLMMGWGPDGRGRERGGPARSRCSVGPGPQKWTRIEGGLCLSSIHEAPGRQPAPQERGAWGCRQPPPTPPEPRLVAYGPSFYEASYIFCSAGQPAAAASFTWHRTSASSPGSGDHRLCSCQGPNASLP